VTKHCPTSGPAPIRDDRKSRTTTVIAFCQTYVEGSSSGELAMKSSKRQHVEMAHSWDILRDAIYLGHLRRMIVEWGSRSCCLSAWLVRKEDPHTSSYTAMLHGTIRSTPTEIHSVLIATVHNLSDTVYTSYNLPDTV
jgi:hypothetical protein